MFSLSNLIGSSILRPMVGLVCDRDGIAVGFDWRLMCFHKPWYKDFACFLAPSCSL